MRSVLPVLAVLVSFLGLTGEAAACSCMRPSGSLAEAQAEMIAASEAAFVGRVVALREAEGQIVAEVAVSEALKGRVSRNSFAVTPDGSSANCSLKDAFEAARRTSRPMTFVSSRSLRIAGVRAHAVGLCDTGFFLRD